MNRNSITSARNLDEKLCKMFKFCDKIVVNFLDIEENFLDCFDLLSFVELFQGKVHTLRVVY